MLSAQQNEGDYTKFSSDRGLTVPNGDVISVGYTTPKLIKYEHILEILMAKQYVVILALVSQHDH